MAPMSDADRRAHERVTIAGDLRDEVLVLYQPRPARLANPRVSVRRGTACTAGLHGCRHRTTPVGGGPFLAGGLRLVG